MDLNLKAFCLYCNSDENKIIKTVISVQFVVQLFLLQALKLVMPSISVVFVRDASHYQYAEVLLVSLYEHKFVVFICMISVYRILSILVLCFTYTNDVYNRLMSCF